jgi:hypothetical protein
VDSSSLPELKEFSFFLCLSAHFLDALLAEYLLHRTFNSSVSFCAPFAPAQCPPGRALRILSDSVSLNSQQSSFQLHLVHMLNAHLAELYRIHSRILSATVSLIHSLASKVFNNLEVFFL